MLISWNQMNHLNINWAAVFNQSSFVSLDWSFAHDLSLKNLNFLYIKKKPTVTVKMKVHPSSVLKLKCRQDHAKKKIIIIIFIHSHCLEEGSGSCLLWESYSSAGKRELVRVYAEHPWRKLVIRGWERSDIGAEVPHLAGK